MSDIPTLTFEDSTAPPQSFNVCLYGPTGSGKSAAAATAPGPILWVNTQGDGAIAYAKTVAARRGTQILEVKINRQTPNVKLLLRHVMEYIRNPGADNPVPRTVVIDMLADLRALLIRQVVVPGAKNSIQQFGEVADILMDLVLWLRDRKDLNVVILCHPEMEVAEGERTVRPLIGGAITERVPAEMDVVGYSTVFRDDEDNVKYVAQLIEGKGRVAKNRSGALGAVRTMDLSEWLEAYIAALTPDDLPFDTLPQDPSPSSPDEVAFPSKEEASEMAGEARQQVSAQA